MRLGYFIAILLATCSLIAQAAIDRFYRYTDENGVVVINSSISPERAAKGYEILDANGRMLERIAPALTGDELAEYLTEQELKNKQEADAKKQLAYDLSLLQRYSFVSDIEDEQKRQLAQLNTRSAILRGNLIGFRSELEKSYEEAARFERQEKPVPEKTKGRIANLEEKITATEQMLAGQSQEVERLKQDYIQAIKRFKELEVRRGRRLE